MIIKKNVIIALIVLIGAVQAAPAHAADHPRWDARGLTELYPASNAIDGSKATAWSSAYHSTGSAYEWFAFWFGGTYSTNYVRLAPSTYNGVNVAVPTFINIYYSANSTWNYLTSVPLSADIAQGGYTISFPSVTTDGFLFTTDSLRPDAFGGYYFQLAEVNGGWADRFFGWSQAWESSPIPLSTMSSLQAGQARQFVICTYNSTTADCPTAPVISFIQQGNYGQLFILGDEPDLMCTPPATVASMYASFVQTILAVDSTARFSPPGFSQPVTVASCPSAPHFTDYAQQFFDALPAPRPVDEWRFHAFGHAKSAYPTATCDYWTDSTWHGWVETAAAWSVAHGAPMVLGSFGFPDPADAECDIVNTGWEESMLTTVLNDTRIVAAVWWPYSWPNFAHPLKNTSEGALYQTYRYR